MQIVSVYSEGDVIYVIYAHRYYRHALISNNEDDTYTIFLPAGVSQEKRKELALHELEHLKRGDLYSEDYVWDIERRIE